MSSSVTPAHPRPKPVAKRKGARRALPPVTVPNRSRKPCAFLCCTTSQKVPQSQQAGAASPRGLRLPGKRTPSLPRLPASSQARARATRTQPRCPDACGTLHTPPGEWPKAPAKTAARVPPDPQRRARLTASSYLPSLQLPAAIYRSPCSSGGPAHPNNLHLTSRCDLLRGSCTINRVLTSASIEATVAAGRDASVTQEISWSSGKKNCYVSICWAPLKQALRIALSGSGQRRPLRFCAIWLLREASA
jgi:hypothetical protein